MKPSKILILGVLAIGLSACSTAQMKQRVADWSNGFPSFFKFEQNKKGYAYGEKLLAENNSRPLAIHPITTPKAIKAWYVYDSSVPVVDIKFSFDKGSVYDPEGKEGTAALLAAMLNEGAGQYNAQQFQKIMQDNAIDVYFDASKDTFAGHMRTTREHLTTAGELLKLAVQAPRFDDEAVTRMKNDMMMSLKYKQSKPGWYAGKAMREFVFAGHPYSRSADGLLKTIPLITQGDLKALWQQIAVKDGLTIGVTGDVTQSEVETILDNVFAPLPDTSARADIAAVELQQPGKVILIPREGSQTYLLAVQKGLHREDPDWFTAQIINYNLAGGGFNSRLMESVRVQNSLTYGISSSLVDQDYAPVWMVQSDVDNKGVKQTIQMIKTEWQNVRDNGLTEEELSAAKAYLIGALPLAMDSTGAISSILVQMQEDGLPYDYLDYRSRLIDSVTPDDVKRVAQTLLQPDNLTFILAGTYNVEPQ